MGSICQIPIERTHALEAFRKRSEQITGMPLYTKQEGFHHAEIDCGRWSKQQGPGKGSTLRVRMSARSAYYWVRTTSPGLPRNGADPPQEAVNVLYVRTHGARDKVSAFIFQSDAVGSPTINNSD